ncbi:hypothetical protein CDD83_11187 [Cordyceps sp. RAO-2017]|nr:hypothetical protein CDD83_11187 [Cordyceps sp. RAO-2017]
MSGRRRNVISTSTIQLTQPPPPEQPPFDARLNSWRRGFRRRPVRAESRHLEAAVAQPLQARRQKGCRRRRRDIVVGRKPLRLKRLPQQPQHAEGNVGRADADGGELSGEDCRVCPLEGAESRGLLDPELDEVLRKAGQAGPEHLAVDHHGGFLLRSRGRHAVLGTAGRALEARG